MFASKPKEREEARRLRREEGLSIKRIAARLQVSPSSVHLWTRDIRLTAEQTRRNLSRRADADGAAAVAARARAWSQRSRQRRLAYQREGRERARRCEPLHIAGCMLYWAEGAKRRNVVKLSNSDANMVRMFCLFLRSCLGVQAQAFTLHLNVYTGNGITLAQIEEHWLDALELPRSCLRKHTVNHRPTSSSGLKRNKLPYGVATVAVGSTRTVQHIYGAIQEYGSFDEPRWLD